MTTDVQNIEFKVGQKVARPRMLSVTSAVCYIEIVKVTKVDGDKVYLDHSTQPMKFPNRLAILGD